jgi:hypothetical protein
MPHSHRILQCQKKRKEKKEQVASEIEFWHKCVPISPWEVGHCRDIASDGQGRSLLAFISPEPSSLQKQNAFQFHIHYLNFFYFIKSAQDDLLKQFFGGRNYENNKEIRRNRAITFSIWGGRRTHLGKHSLAFFFFCHPSSICICQGQTKRFCLVRSYKDFSVLRFSQTTAVLL